MYMQIIGLVAILGVLAIGIGYKSKKNIIGGVVAIAVYLFLWWASGTMF